MDLFLQYIPVITLLLVILDSSIRGLWSRYKNTSDDVALHFFFSICGWACLTILWLWVVA